MQRMQQNQERDDGDCPGARVLYSIGARLLDVSRTTVWRWIKQGRLSAYRIGGRTIRIRRTDVEEMRQPVHGHLPDPRDIFANYDPEKVRQAFRQARGGLKGID